MANDGFFAKANKRKRMTSGGRNGALVKAHKSSDSKYGKPALKKRRHNEDLDSETSDNAEGNIDDLEFRGSDIDEKASGDENENETAATKRLRLAKLYLRSVKEDLADGEVDAAEIDRETITSRLRQDVLQNSGKLHLLVADTLSKTTQHPFVRLKGHRFSITSAVVSDDGRTLFTAGKEGSIIGWNLLNGKRLVVFPKVRPNLSSTDRKGKVKMTADTHAANELQGHTDEVLALALSSDGKYLASGGRDRRLGVWDVAKKEWVRSFGGHRDIISALSFRKGTHTLYTASFDRTLKSFDLGAMGYVETLFGHQDCVTCVDALRGEIAVSSGGQDRTIRYWKIVDETQLVFRGGGRSKMRELLESGGIDDLEPADDAEGSRRKKNPGGFVEGRIDCVAMLDETLFVSGGDSGSLSLWSTTKKKPLFSYPCAHGVEEKHATDSLSSSGPTIRNPRWITSIATLPYSDIFASGSWSGQIHLWKVDTTLRSFSPLHSLSVAGFVNSLQIIRTSAGFLASTTWLSSSTANGSAPPMGSDKTRDIILVAGMGQEPRLGRWMQLKGQSVQNATFVFALTRASPNMGTTELVTGDS